VGRVKLCSAYRTNTEPGSSGSPCVDVDWNVIALHHAGDPNYDLAHTPQGNQGVPFDAISNPLTARGFGGLLNQKP
jgi:V8-like Glu-specific endopeptidase